MNQTLKFVLVTAAGFALGYTLYGMMKGKTATVVEKRNGNGNGAAAKPSPSPEAVGDAVAGVLID